MVTGSEPGRLRSVSLELFEARTAPGDGAVVVIGSESPTGLLERLTGGSGNFEPGRLAVLDASGASEDDHRVGWLRRVAPGADAEAVDGSVSEALAWLDGRDVDRRHFLYEALATSGGLSGPDAAYDRAYELAMTVGAEEGLSVFTLDTGDFTAPVVEKLTHLFDVHVTVRGNGDDTEIRWTGLLGASDGWVRLADADLGVGGFE